MLLVTSQSKHLFASIQLQSKYIHVLTTLANLLTGNKIVKIVYMHTHILNKISLDTILRKQKQ